MPMPTKLPMYLFSCLGNKISLDIQSKKLFGKWKKKKQGYQPILQCFFCITSCHCSSCSLKKALLKASSSWTMMMKHQPQITLGPSTFTASCCPPPILLPPFLLTILLPLLPAFQLLPVPDLPHLLCQMPVGIYLSVLFGRTVSIE